MQCLRGIICRLNTGSPKFGEFLVRQLSRHPQVLDEFHIRDFIGLVVTFFIHDCAGDLQHVLDDIGERIGREALFQRVTVVSGHEAV